MHAGLAFIKHAIGAVGGVLVVQETFNRVEAEIKRPEERGRVGNSVRHGEGEEEGQVGKMM